MGGTYLSNPMKKLVSTILLITTLISIGCQYDDSEVLNEINDLKNRVEVLEQLCNRMNDDISSLQNLVMALQQNDYVSSVTEITENGVVIGYEIKFTKSNPIIIKHGQNGNDGYSPIVGVAEDGDGTYYWTLDGEWLLDDFGNKLKVQGTDGFTPQFKIEDEYWHISYDGINWINLGKASGEDGDSFFQNVTKDEEYVYFNLSDGTMLKIPLASDGVMLSVKFEAKLNPISILYDIECDINNNGIISGRIPNIVDSKKLIPTFEYEGSKILIGDTEFIQGETVLDCSKPVEITLVGSNGAKKEYTIEIIAFTGLPLMFINTEDNTDVTSKDEYLKATIKIVEDIKTRAAGDVWTSEVKIKGRGNSTWTMPKKPYKLKFDEKVSLLGEPSDKEWVLLANYTDKTAIRNELAFFMGRMSLLNYTCRTHYVDLILNNKYIGTYQLGEQQKIAKNRVNVGDDGYLLEIDAKASADDIVFKISTISKPINIKDPDVEMDSEEYNYIVNFLTEAETALYSKDFTNEETGYSKYLDVTSFIDWYLINEIAKNNDANFFTSCYMHHKKGGKLCMGPLWDFDIAFGNVNYSNCRNPEGFWIRNVNWYTRLFKDPKFVDQVKKRFDYFYSNKDVIFNEINENANYLKYSVLENNAVWGTLYEYTWPNNAVWGSYENEVAYLKQWLNARLEWLKVQFDNM